VKRRPKPTPDGGVGCGLFSVPLCLPEMLMSPIPTVLCLVLCAPVADKQAEQILGNWTGKDKVGDEAVQVSLNFFRDGTLTIEMRTDRLSLRQSGTYKFVTENAIEVTTLQRDKVHKEKHKVKITTDKLVLVDDNGVSREYARLKSKVADLVVGKWSAKEKAGDKELEIVIEFTKDGKLLMDLAGLMKLEGTYKVIDDRTLEVTMKNPVGGEEKTEKGPFSVTSDRLTLKDPGGKEMVFTRVMK
jgi:uncharacterized protein (TIGR03066 family)